MNTTHRRGKCQSNEANSDAAKKKRNTRAHRSRTFQPDGPCTPNQIPQVSRTPARNRISSIIIPEPTNANAFHVIVAITTLTRPHQFQQPTCSPAFNGTASQTVLLRALHDFAHPPRHRCPNAALVGGIPRRRTRQHRASANELRSERRSLVWLLEDRSGQ
jgi:hypothetical protein